MASKLYGKFLLNAINGEVNWTSDDIKVMLVADTYTPDQDAHDYLDDVVANEVSGTGYTAGGATLASKTLTYDTANNYIILDAADVTWASSTITARYAVVYSDAGATNAQKVLIGYVDFGSNQSSSAGNFLITWDANGVARVTVA